MLLYDLVDVCFLPKVPGMVLEASLLGLDPATTYAITLTAFTSEGMGSGSPSSDSTLYDGEHVHIVCGTLVHLSQGTYIYTRVGTLV